jgi:hypothetical protein
VKERGGRGAGEPSKVADHVGLVALTDGRGHGPPASGRGAVEQAEGTPDAQDPLQQLRGEPDVVGDPAYEAADGRPPIPGERNDATRAARPPGADPRTPHPGRLVADYAFQHSGPLRGASRGRPIA